MDERFLPTFARIYRERRFLEPLNEPDLREFSLTIQSPYPISHCIIVCVHSTTFGAPVELQVALCIGRTIYCVMRSSLYLTKDVCDRKGLRQVCVTRLIRVQF